MLFFPLLGSGQGKNMAVTIDDLPAHLIRHDSATLLQMNREIIGHLLGASVPAIGFVNEGKLYENNRLVAFKSQMLSEWTSAGLELGNHTYGHLDYNRLTPADFFVQVEKGEPISRQLMENTGQKMIYFRHPFLHRGNTPEKVLALESYLTNRGYIEAPVTIDNSEWIFANAYDKAHREGDTVLMGKVGKAYVNYMTEKAVHYERQSGKLFGRNIDHILLIHANLLNAGYLGDLLTAYAKMGYEFVSLTEALKDPAYLSKDTFVGNAGISWLDRWALTQGKEGDFFLGEPRCPQFILEYTGLTE